MMFIIAITWPRVSCWLCCVAVNWLILVLIPLTPLAVVVPVNQLSASPRKGRRLLLVYLLETKTPSNEGSFFKS